MMPHKNLTSFMKVPLTGMPALVLETRMPWHQKRACSTHLSGSLKFSPEFPFHIIQFSKKKASNGMNAN